MTAYLGRQTEEAAGDMKYFNMAKDYYKKGIPIVELLGCFPKKYLRVAYLAYEVFSSDGTRRDHPALGKDWPTMFRVLLSKFDVEGLAFRIQTPSSVVKAIQTGLVVPTEMVRKRIRNLYCVTFNINGKEVKL